MEKQSININIFGRRYPVVVENPDEAAAVQEAANTIDAKLKAFKAEYRTQDNFDLAIMVCLDIMTEFLGFKSQQQNQSESVLSELAMLEKKLDYSIELSQNG